MASVIKNPKQRMPTGNVQRQALPDVAYRGGYTQQMFDTSSGMEGIGKGLMQASSTLSSIAVQKHRQNEAEKAKAQREAESAAKKAQSEGEKYARKQAALNDKRIMLDLDTALGGFSVDPVGSSAVPLDIPAASRNPFETESMTSGSGFTSNGDESKVPWQDYYTEDELGYYQTAIAKASVDAGIAIKRSMIAGAKKRMKAMQVRALEGQKAEEIEIGTEIQKKAELSLLSNPYNPANVKQGIQEVYYGAFNVELARHKIPDRDKAKKFAALEGQSAVETLVNRYTRDNNYASAIGVVQNHESLYADDPTKAQDLLDNIESQEKTFRMEGAARMYEDKRFYDKVRDELKHEDQVKLDEMAEGNRQYDTKMKEKTDREIRSAKFHRGLETGIVVAGTDVFDEGLINESKLYAHNSDTWEAKDSIEMYETEMSSEELASLNLHTLEEAKKLGSSYKYAIKLQNKAIAIEEEKAATLRATTKKYMEEDTGYLEIREDIPEEVRPAVEKIIMEKANADGSSSVEELKSLANKGLTKVVIERDMSDEAAIFEFDQTLNQTVVKYGAFRVSQELFDRIPQDTKDRLMENDRLEVSDNPEYTLDNIKNATVPTHQWWREGGKAIEPAKNPMSMDVKKKLFDGFGITSHDLHWNHKQGRYDFVTNDGKPMHVIYNPTEDKWETGYY